MPQTPRIVNRKARYQYEILETFEAGIALRGAEVKSIRSGQISIKDGFVRIDRGNLMLYNVHVSPYEKANRFNSDPLRPRQLLMHRREIDKLDGKVRTKGLTLIPLVLYFKRGKVKIEIGLAKGKRTIDRRQEIIEREANRSIERALRGEKE